CSLARALTSRPPTSAAAASIFRSAAWSVIAVRPRSRRTVIRTSPENRPASRSGSRWRSYSVGRTPAGRRKREGRGAAVIGSAHRVSVAGERVASELPDHLLAEPLHRGEIAEA